jgi:hypothetical protein
MSRGATRSKVLPASTEDLRRLLPLRIGDAEEILATGRDPQVALYEAFSVSWPHVFTIFVDGEPAGVFGVGQGDTPETGHPWMLGNDQLVTIPRDLVSEGRIWVQYLSRLYPHLVNYVHSNNRVSIRWLKLMGFEFPADGTVTLLNGHQFRRFTFDV